MTLSDTSRQLTRSVLYTIVATTALYVLFLLAPVSYILAYRWYIPQSFTLVPVYMDYAPVGFYCPNYMQSARLQNSVPSSIINLHDAQIPRSVPYSISVQLNLPRDDHNSKLGISWLD